MSQKQKDSWTAHHEDELAADGTILNGFDYAVQVWVEDGICLAVGLGRDYAGLPIAKVPGHEVRGEGE